MKRSTLLAAIFSEGNIQGLNVIIVEQTYPRNNNPFEQLLSVRKQLVSPWISAAKHQDMRYHECLGLLLSRLAFRQFSKNDIGSELSLMASSDYWEATWTPQNHEPGD